MFQPLWANSQLAELAESGMHGGPPVPPDHPAFWSRFFGVAFLVLFGGLLAGLTLGLMSLNATSLHVLANGGDPQQRKWAARIQPIRANGHLLLVTLLLTNTLVNEALPIVMDSIIGGGWVAVLASTGLIFVFGEIIPQSVCARHGLRIGAFFAWPVRILIWVMYVVAYPISKLLDWILGEEHQVIYRRAELKELVAFHSDVQHGDLSHDEVTIIRGVLDMQSKCAGDIMTPIDDTFGIDINACLDRVLLTQIVETGHSRIPVYEGRPDNIIGILLSKSLILLDPDDAIPVSSVRLNYVAKVTISTPAFDLLNAFQEGNSHMAVVLDGEERMVGVITLEDVIEELIQEEIVDETDVYVDMHTKLKVARAFRNAFTRTPAAGARPVRTTRRANSGGALSRRKHVSVGRSVVTEATPLLSGSLDLPRNGTLFVTGSPGDHRLEAGIHGHQPS